MPRCNLVTTIQIAKRQLDMDDADYRAVLERITGKASSKDLRLVEKKAVIAEMERLGFKVEPRKGGRKWQPKEERKDIRYILVLWRLLAEKRVVERGRHALNGFVASKKFHKKYSEAPTDVRFLTIERTRDVIEALKDMCRRNGIVVER